MGSDSIRGYVLHARGLSWYILQGNPPWGDLLPVSVSRKGQVFRFFFYFHHLKG